MSMPVSKPRPRPAHTEGTTRCAYTPDGSRLVTVGSNNTIRVYRTGHDGEPANVDECPEQNTCVAAADDFFVVGAEDGTVSLYTARPGSQTPPEFDRFLVRCSLPVRDVALSPNDGGAWCAVASDELTVKLVHTRDASRPVRTLREHARPTKHLAFDTKGSILALSCTDGVVYFYSLTADEPELMRKVDGVAARLETDTDASSAIAWHPDGRAFAVPTATRDVQVVGARDDWERQRSFANGHTGDVTALAWSPNGALLATAGRDRKLLLWETKTQSVVARYDYAGVQDIRWHPHVGKNLVSFTNAMGEVYICPDFVPEQFAGLLQLPTQPAPFIHDPLKSGSGNAGRRQEGVNGHKTTLAPRPRRRGGSPGSVDSFDEEARGGVFGDDDDDDFVVDDDGAGYALNGNKKRSRDEDGLDEQNGRSKRLYVSEEAAYHEPFQPGSTPWRGNRKYLCLNLVGFVWTIDQGSHHTVTVEFYDHDLHRDFHFTDTFRYDKACLNHHGALFSNEPADEDGKDGVATVFYRPHETWTQRSDWRTQLPRGERVVAISLSESFVTVATDRYIRIFTLFGIPYRVYRPKNAPVVTCTSWKDYVMTVSNGPSGPDGYTKLVYSIEDVKHDEIIQNEDIVALPEDATLKSVFFSDKGDPCIYDSTGTLLVLVHWRRPSRASWVPVLDTRLLDRLATGRKQETYFPVAVADDRFHCIILKGGDAYPYFPRPLLSEFDLEIPLTSVADTEFRLEQRRKRREEKKAAAANGAGDGMLLDDEDEDEDEAEDREARKLYQQYLLSSLSAAQLEDVVASSTSGQGGTYTERATLSRLRLEADKALLQLLALECRIAASAAAGGDAAADQRGMRALELVSLMHDTSGRMADAAGKVADRYGRALLGEKIRELAEKKVAEAEAEVDGDVL